MGTLLHLKTIVALARRYQAWTMVDEAHATGVFGQHGAGVVEEQDLTQDIDIHMGTLGKALGGFGAYVAGSRALIEWLINRARSFIYTTGVPPAVAATARRARCCRRRFPGASTAVWENDLSATGLTAWLYRDRAIAHSSVASWGAENNGASRGLLQRVFLPAFVLLPTTVPRPSRLRVTPMATHSREQLGVEAPLDFAAWRRTGISRDPSYGERIWGLPKRAERGNALRNRFFNVWQLKGARGH
jgi:7-keto-8-aminopelargonate synthetase-like enzyme